MVRNLDIQLAPLRYTFHSIACISGCGRALKKRKADQSAGGGYVLPGNPEQFKFLWQIQEQLQKKGKSVSILYLDYGKFGYNPLLFRCFSLASNLCQIRLKTYAHLIIN